MPRRRPRAIIQKARALRSSSTDAERRLWASLRGRQMGGTKFRRQHPIGPYIVDFCSVGARLIIEIDGEQHQQAAERRYDVNRSAELEALGFRVLRFSNHEVLRETDGVLEHIRKVLGKRWKDAG